MTTDCVSSRSDAVELLTIACRKCPYVVRRTVSAQGTLPEFCPRCYGDLYVVPPSSNEWELSENDKRLLGSLKIGVE